MCERMCYSVYLGKLIDKLIDFWKKSDRFSIEKEQLQTKSF